jgi:hypothetical protein
VRIFVEAGTIGPINLTSQGRLGWCGLPALGHAAFSSRLLEGTTYPVLTCIDLDQESVMARPGAT